MAFSWLCACKTRQAEISRLRMVATSFSRFGICPMLAHSSMSAYIHYIAPVEEQNFGTLITFLNAMEVREDDETFQNPIDQMFEALEKKARFGICPMLAHSSMRQRTWTGSRPWYTSSAFSHSRLKSWLYIMLMRKLKVLSVSLMMRNRAVFRSPRVSSSSSSPSSATWTPASSWAAVSLPP